MGVLDTIISDVKKPPDIHAGEVYALWTNLQARYDTLETINIFINLVKDMQLKMMLEMGVKDLINPQIKKLEDIMNKYKLPLPPAPQKRVNIPSNTEIAADETMYRLIYDITQTSLSVHVKAINISTNDVLAELFTDFLSDELHTYKNLLNYGRSKGWIHSPPIWKNQ